MYLSMDSNTLTNEALRQPQGSLAYELAESLGNELDNLFTDNEKLEDEAGESSNKVIDLCGEAVSRIEQIEDRINDVLETVPDHQDKGTYADMQENLKTALELLNDAVIYFNGQQEN